MLIKDVYPQPTIAGLRLYEASNPPLWYGAVLSSFGIGFNVDTVKYLGMEAPRTWPDLKDPRYRNWLLAADPTRSSTAKTLFMVIVERKMADAEAEGRSPDEGWADGMGLVRQIAANCRNFNDTANTVPAIVGSGDVAAAMMIDFFARTQIQFIGDRMQYVEPANATVINADPIAMIKGAPHEETAKRFVEFLLSEPGQRLWNIKAGLPGGPKLTSLRRLPIRRSVYSDKTGFTDPVNPFEQTTSFNTSPARTKTFEILGLLIQASCMDVLDELKATRAAILACPRAAELDAKLGRFPFDQKEALKRQDQYKKATTAERLELMRKWTDEFRQEYRELMSRARG
jgi:ABC-type Fe3+ transport system substrate-binding protein